MSTAHASSFPSATAIEVGGPYRGLGLVVRRSIQTLTHLDLSSSRRFLTAGQDLPLVSPVVRSTRSSLSYLIAQLAYEYAHKAVML